ncbi:MAG: hypothetical protein LC121_07810 [Anaerolineae bacterium]|nr:hypothetical protein [Anaerolineae bacterium]
MRQATRPLEVEVVGMMDMILEELEATDLPRDDYRRLRDDGAAMLRQLLDAPVRQLPLTPPARPIFEDMAAQRPADHQPADLPIEMVIGTQQALPPPPADLPEPPPLPDTMPEEIQAPPAAAPVEPAKRLFDPNAVPIFFNPGTNAQRGSVPPVPPPAAKIRRIELPGRRTNRRSASARKKMRQVCP